MMDFEYNAAECTLCPRACHGDRRSCGGICGAPDKMRVARAALHFWEEPCIAGKNGTGAVFFSGCPLKCVYCQNPTLSKEAVGSDISAGRLQEICFELKGAGAHSIDLVTPCHFAPYIRDALLPVKKELGIPLIVNTGGYDSSEELGYFEGVADIYLPDFKYAVYADGLSDPDARDYTAVAEKALEIMFGQVGRPVFDDDGMLVSGMIVRNLVLPGRRRDSIAAIDLLRSLFLPGDILVSVMSQYTPQNGAEGDLSRKITDFEYRSVLDHVVEAGFGGYSQRRTSAKREYTPDFDNTGVLKADGSGK